MIRPASGAKLTWDDLMLLPDDGRRHELIDGEHVVTASPIRRHQLILVNLGGLMWEYLRAHPIGTMFNVPMDVILSNHDLVEPDLLYYSHERARSFEPSPWVKGVPNLVVEVLSASTRKRDLTSKRWLYERSGVDEYWLIDPDEESVDVLRFEGGVYVAEAQLRRAADDVLTTPFLPDLKIRLRDVFAG